MARPLKILFASPEVQPFAKTGGLADVAGALPPALKALGHDVRVILPKYRSVLAANTPIAPLGLEVEALIGTTKKKGFLYRGALAEAVPAYLLENDGYFLRNHLYGTRAGDYPDNAERFIFFCQALLETCLALRFIPDIIHLNDWPTGLVPVYLKTRFKDAFENTKTVFSIHNLGYQGNFPPHALTLSGLPASLFHPEGMEFYGQFSFMKTALMFSDLLTTVSPSYRKEIQTPAFGFGMDGVLRTRAHDLHGVLNGADYDRWDPARDPWIAAAYGPNNLKGKDTCRKYLERYFVLDVAPRRPLVSMITRLNRQKGLDLAMQVMDDLLETGAGFVLLGQGEDRYEEYFRHLNSHPRAGVSIGFDEALAHRILAGSDILFMPSGYEPCGLTQMYAMKYGTVPLVRSVGGLKDTVREFQPATGRGTGFRFRGGGKPDCLRALGKALSIYRNKASWGRLKRAGMTEDFSWARTAEKYVRLYRKALRA
jgi:starch synthase